MCERDRIAAAFRLGRRIAGIGAGLVLAAWIGAAAAQTAPASPPAEPPPAKPAEPVEHIHLNGFRSASWGMNAAEVKAAIKKDFNIPADKVHSEENVSERTTVLSVVVPDLIEGAGKAHLSYILGYSTKKLIQINVTWGSPVDRQARPDDVVAAANQLRALFLSSGYQPDTVTSNVPSTDGTIVVFEGQDADRHTTLLRLANGMIQPAAKNGKKEPPVPTVALQLSYILDARNPDIFRLKKGSF
jgi:hypothetical protein